MVAEDDSDSEELVLPGLDLEENVALPDSLPESPEPPSESSKSPDEDSVAPSSDLTRQEDNSEEIILPGLEEMDKTEEENETDNDDSPETSAFEQEEALPKDGEEWEDWNGWDKIQTGKTVKTDSDGSVPEPAREAAMEESDKIWEQSEETAEESVPEVDDQLDVSAHRMELTVEDFGEDKPDASTDSELPDDLSGLDAAELNGPNTGSRLPDPDSGEDSDFLLETNPQSEEVLPLESESSVESDSPSKRQAEDILDAQSGTSDYEAPFTEEDDSERSDDSGRSGDPGRSGEENYSSVLTLPKLDSTNPASEKPKDAKVLILTEDLMSLLERVDQTRKAYLERPVQTDRNSPYEAIMSIWAFGCQANVRYMPDGLNFNAVAALCWNYPIGELPTLGWRELDSDEAASERSIQITAPGTQTDIKLAPLRVFPMTGYCQQERPGDLLAALAMARVPADYQFKLDGQDCSVGDLIETESRLCVGGDMSAQLAALSYYRARDIWKNQFRQTVSVRKILEHELRRAVNRGSSEATERLFGITFALRRRLAFRNIPLETVYVKADEYLKRFSGFVLDLQNGDGSWHGQYFMRKGKSIDPDADFAATGNIARWLLLAIPNDRLDDPKIIAAIDFLTAELENRLKRYDPAEQSQSLTKGYAYALEAIGIFQQRWGGRDVKHEE